MLENRINSDLLKSSFTFFLKKGKFQDIEYVCSLSLTCRNPRCTCQDLRVEIRENNDKIKEDPLYIFYINLREKIISPDFRKDISSESLQFARAFIKEMEPEGWTTLQEFLIAAKMYIHDRTDLKELEVEFDDNLIDNNTMIAWHKIFPYAEQIIKEINGSIYLLDDHYCLQSDCRCTHVALSIVKIENNEAAEKRHSACYLSYNKNIVEPLDGPVTIDMKDIITKYSFELKKEYRKRHEILRKLYRDYRKRSVLTNTKTVPNISQSGRNDPCPCGSGKKFKKCCMI